MHIEMKGITKYFGAVKALENVNFTINSHEIHGLMGENGAGKSTLMNILGGAIQPTEGEIYINGELIEKMTISLATENGIRFIHQELNLVNDLKVYENLYLGEELTNKIGILDKKQMIENSKEVLEKLDDKMTQAFDGVYEMAQSQNVYMRDAAYMVAIDRVVKAMELRGWL